MKNVTMLVLIALAVFAAVNLKGCTKSVPPEGTSYLPARHN